MQRANERTDASKNYKIDVSFFYEQSGIISYQTTSTTQCRPHPSGRSWTKNNSILRKQKVCGNHYEHALGSSYKYHSCCRPVAIAFSPLLLLFFSLCPLLLRRGVTRGTRVVNRLCISSFDWTHAEAVTVTGARWREGKGKLVGVVVILCLGWMLGVERTVESGRTRCHFGHCQCNTNDRSLWNTTHFG